MDSRNMSLGTDSIDWSDPAFAGTSEFQDSMVAESPWGNSALNDFTNLDQYGDSPAALNLRTPSKSGPEAGAPATAQQPSLPVTQSMSTESSSQDSSSDSSSRRKRKTTSESPVSELVADSKLSGATVSNEGPVMGVGYQDLGPFNPAFSQPMPRLAVDQDMSDTVDGMFDFNSAASSPNLPRDFNNQLSLDAKINIPVSATAPGFSQGSPPQTINPGMFTLEGSRDQSPVTKNVMFNNASPNPLFSTPSSDSNEPFGTNQNWNSNLGQNPSWVNEFQPFTSPDGLAFTTPSPMQNGGTPSVPLRDPTTIPGRSRLHIAPIATKSRVETQINVIMTLEQPPPGIEHLHLPLHTIAKSKLLAKDDFDPSKVLELHTMLVCSSAMHNQAAKEKALSRAAMQNNDEIQKRAEAARESGDEERNDMKNVDEADKPANGGEVRICNNCIQRERKRAGRKKLKKEEEQQHWERYETERVVVFNSNEYLPFKPYERKEQLQREGGMVVEENYDPPAGALSVMAAMRIACYCRHQSEKEGFQVIFTLKDQSGNVVAQEISDSILITDDHKTHPPTLTTMSSDMVFHPQQFPNGLTTSYSMMDLPTHSQTFTTSRSAGNLQALAYGQQSQFNPHSHVHQLSNGGGYISQATSATMTPTSLSRPGSPNSAGQSGPNKKRKSSTFHRRVPSGLVMTPRVDTSQPPSATLSSGISMPSNFSPTGTTFNQQNDQSFMTIPNNAGPAQFFGSGPPTPANENSNLNFGHPHQLDIARAQNASAYFSHPSSAVPSRSNSPVLQSARPALAGYQRHPIQTPTNQINRAQQMFAPQGSTGSENDQVAAPTITKITPIQGPVTGGTEVSIYGYNFTHGTQIMFGDAIAPTTFYGTQSILATSPPGRRGGVRVKIVPTPGTVQYNSSGTNNPVFTYTDTNPQVMELALRFFSQQRTGDPGRWAQYANEVANEFLSSSISPAGISGQGYNGGNMLANEPVEMEGILLRLLDSVDISESPREPCYDISSADGQTMLSSASAAGLHRVVAALLARGAHPDIRDVGGYTPLMHAALQGRLRTFQLLLIKGADSTIRSLKGYSAVDLVSDDLRDQFIRILQDTKRSRSTRPSLHMRYSFGSHTSSKASWDISSASFYDSEADSSEHTVSMPPSRRPSANAQLHLEPINEPEPSQQTPSAAMVAWRDALASQIYHFQQSVHSSMSNFQLPALPPLPDYQDNPMVRRLSSLVPARYSSRCVPHVETPEESQPCIQQPRFWDMFSSPSPAPSIPPPSYSELFPDVPPESDDRDKNHAIRVAVVDAVADEKCAMIEKPQLNSCSSQRSELENGPKKAEYAALTSWFWMPILVIMTSLITPYAMAPYVSSTPAISTLQNRLTSVAV